MQFSVATFFALAGAAIAQFVEPTPGFNPLTNPVSGEVIPAGKPFTIKWTQGGKAGPISLYAYAGDSAGSLQEVGTIATGLDAAIGQYIWDVDPALGGKYKAYGIKIALASDKDVYQWSQPFTISGSASSGSSSVASTSGAGSSASETAKTDKPTTMTTMTSSTAPTTSASTVTSAYVPLGNLSTTASSPASTSGPVTLPSSTGTRGPAGTSTAPARIPTGAAANLGASSLAVLGGLAMAVMAM